MLKKSLVFVLFLTLLLSSCSQPTYAFRFQTDDEADWKFEEETDISRRIEDGVYVMEMHESGLYAWENVGVNVKDPTISISIADVGVAMDGSYGLMCNYQDELNHYVAGFGSDMTYFILKTVAGEDTLLLGNSDGSYLVSQDIDPTASVYKAELTCADGVLRLSVNGKVIGTAMDDTFESGDVGFFAVSFQQVPLTIEFDDLMITGEIVADEEVAAEE